jgi:hypothetical protein
MSTELAGALCDGSQCAATTSAADRGWYLCRRDPLCIMAMTLSHDGCSLSSMRPQRSIDAALLSGCSETEFVRLRPPKNQPLANFFGHFSSTTRTEIVGLTGFATRICWIRRRVRLARVAPVAKGCVRPTTAIRHVDSDREQLQSNGIF